MPSLGAPELIVVLFIVLILFGAGRLADMGKSLGQGIREFRHAMQEEQPTATPAADTGVPRYCAACGAPAEPGARFCSACGHELNAPVATPAAAGQAATPSAETGAPRAPSAGA